MSAVITLGGLANRFDVEQLLGKRPNKRWGRASLTTPRSDGYSIATWFESYTAEERIKLVSEAFLNGTPWAPLLRFEIPKKPGSTETRGVDMPTVVDQARLYILNDWLAAHAETVLTKVAVAFRRGVRMSDLVLAASRRTKRLPFASVIDVAAFFDSIPWAIVDRTVERLPVDEDVRSLLKRLVRVEVDESGSRRPVKRVQGIPQGLSCSPVIANLALREFDAQGAHALSKIGATLRRYCDDILVQAPSLAATTQAVAIIQARLAKLGLTVKIGTGRPLDTRAESLTWLGIAFGPDGLHVPTEVVSRKVADLQARIDAGLTSEEGVEPSLISLSNYYERTVGPAEAMAVVSFINKGLDLPNIPHTSRKEGIEHLTQLVDDRSRRGSTSYRSTERNKQDDRTTALDSYDRIAPQTVEKRDWLL